MRQRQSIILAAVVLAIGTVAMAGGSCCGGDASATACEMQKAAATQPTTQPAEGAYVCPMGCTTSDKVGKCPKCGMDLVKKTAKPDQPDAHEHMH